MAHFADDLAEAVRRKRSILVMGLDPQLRYMPPHLVRDATHHFGQTHEAVGECFWRFNKAAIDAAEPNIIAVKPQAAFYEAYGSQGVRALEQTVAYARKRGLIVILDAKRGDGSDTAETYADGYLGEVPFFGKDDPTELGRKKSPIRMDCITVHGYIGDDCVGRFVRANKEHGTGVFVVTKTSFKPNSRVEQLTTNSGLKVWQELAHMVYKWGEGTEGTSGYRNVGAVLGATYPEDAAWMRKALPNSWFLVPGYNIVGTIGQGGDTDGAVAAVNKDGLGCVVNSARGLTYAYQKGPFQMNPEEFARAIAEASLAARDELNAGLKRAGKLNW